MSNDDNFKASLNTIKEREAKKQNEYRNASRERLSKIATKKVQTTMIGALSSIEKHFNFLWESEDGILTEEQIQMKNLYDIVRQEILDTGNNQIRNLQTELENYNVEWKRFTINLPVIRKEKSDE